jgi:hypothetical protein
VHKQAIRFGFKGARMKSCVGGLLLAAIAMNQRCSKETLARTGYETLQDIGEEQCNRDLCAQCPERDSYGAYQRKRRESRETGE